MAEETKKSAESSDSDPEDKTAAEEKADAVTEGAASGAKVPAVIAKKPEASDDDSDDDSDDESEGDSDDESDGDSDDESDGDSDDDSEGDSDDESDGDSDDDSDDEVEEDDSVEAVKGTGARDASTMGVARALGVDRDEEEETEEEELAAQAPAATNRALRRREEAMKRRAAREKGAKPAGEDDDIVVAARDTDDKLPKDKNARAKELLRRRRESASGRKVQLDATEIAGDAIARAGSATGKWFKTNIRAIVAVMVLAAGSIAGFLVYTSHKETTIGAASDDLAKGVEADRAPTQKEDKRSDDDKKKDPTVIYTNDDERTAKALAAYEKVANEHPGTGPAILAKLGAAGISLERGDYDKALEGFTQVATSDLANADPDVKGRATEGIGFAREGKKDLDGAMQTFKELESVKNFDNLAKYHQGRVLLAKGDKDKAKEVLVELRKKIEVPSNDGPSETFLTEAVNELLASIDPSLARKPNMVGGMRGNSMTPEEQADAQRRAMDSLRRQIEEQQKNGSKSPIQLPDMPGMPQMPGGPGDDPE